MKAYLFPGQGSQRVGMGGALFDAFPEITATADAILGRSIKELCLDDPDRQLSQTQYTQPALYVVNALAYRQRLQETGDRPAFVAGHSLGEYNALECAGAMSFEDGLDLVKKRGELMSTAPKGTMAAVIGLTADRIGEVLSESGLTAVDVANYNAPDQVIISGLESDIRDAQTFFEQHQAMYIPLNVGGAFHSRYMQPIQAEFDAFLQGFRFSAPEIPVIANIDGLPYQPDDVARRLADQLTHSVRWLDSMHYLLRQGVVDFVELGPGDVLTKLIASIKSRFDAGADSRSEPVPAAARERTAEPAADLPRQPVPTDPQEAVDAWNRTYPVGTKAKVEGYSEPLTTKSKAVVLFGHRAAVYMQGYNGYFALDEMAPVAHTATPA